jgi:hypothetical protein
MKSVSFGLLGVLFLGMMALAPVSSQAGPLNLATLTCQKYQNEVLKSPTAEQRADPINTVMWLFGYSVSKTGAHAMYGDALTGFGFALDAECKNNPNESLQDALGKVKHSEKNPMDLTTLDCGTFAQRDADLRKNDKESADTIMMWLFGFSVEKSGSHVLDADRLAAFEAKFDTECKKRPERSLFDTLTAVKP